MELTKPKAQPTQEELAAEYKDSVRTLVGFARQMLFNGFLDDMPDAYREKLFLSVVIVDKTMDLDIEFEMKGKADA